MLLCPYGRRYAICAMQDPAIIKIWQAGNKIMVCLAADPFTLSHRGSSVGPCLQYNATQSPSTGWLAAIGMQMMAVIRLSSRALMPTT